MPVDAIKLHISVDVLDVEVDVPAKNVDGSFNVIEHRRKKVTELAFVL